MSCSARVANSTVVNDRHSEVKHQIHLISESRKLWLAAADYEEREEWVTVLANLSEAAVIQLSDASPFAVGHQHLSSAALRRRSWSGDIGQSDLL